jgi:hypothetical protein
VQAVLGAPLVCFQPKLLHAAAVLRRCTADYVPEGTKPCDTIQFVTSLCTDSASKSTAAVPITIACNGQMSKINLQASKRIGACGLLVQRLVRRAFARVSFGVCCTKIRVRVSMLGQRICRSITLVVMEAVLRGARPCTRCQNWAGPACACYFLVSC